MVKETEEPIAAGEKECGMICVVVSSSPEYREAILGPIEHLCNRDNHQINATGTTELVTVGSGTVGYGCNRKLTVQGLKKREKKCKKSLCGDTFLTVP